MSETEFRSSLSMEEIEDNFKNTNFFDCVMEGLNEALAYEKGVPSKETIRQMGLELIGQELTEQNCDKIIDRWIR